MRSWRGITWLLAQSIVAGSLCLWISPLPAEDRSEAFLDGLRKREFYDVALDYLEAMRNSPRTSKAFREVIDYETGLTLVANARRSSSKERERQLEEARLRFETFVAEHPEHSLVTAAQAQLADLMVERGRAKAEQAGKSNCTPEEKAQLMAAARTLFQNAQAILTKIDEQLQEKSKDYKNVDPNDVQRILERDQIRTDIMQARLGLASMVFEIARTYEPGSKENKENLEAAVVKFGEYFKKYSRWVGGWYARIDEARCHKALGNYDHAYEILKEIMMQPEEEDSLRRMRTAATAVALEVILLPQMKKYKEAVDIYHNWEQTTGRPGDSSAEALSVKCLAAEGALEYARTLNPSDSRQATTRKECIQLAKDLLTFVARYPGEDRQRARAKMADPLLGGGATKVDMPQNFNEARDRAKLAWDRLQDPDVKEEEIPQLRAEALENFRFALAHAPQSVKLEDLNTIRYCLAYLYWVTEEYYDSAVMGEFLARAYPDRPEAQQGAKIAMAAYAKLFGEIIEGEDRSFEDDQMKNIAQYMADRWPGTPVADEAWLMMIRAAIAKREFGKTIEYLTHIDPESPRRGDTELMTGQSLWAAYLEAMRLPVEKRPSKKEMTVMLTQAQTTLEGGITRLRKLVDAGAEVPYTLAAAALSLAQICLDTGQAEKAVTWLDDPKIGPHTLVVAGNPLVDHGNFRVETLRTTLRAYVAAQQLDRADETMTALEKAAAGANLTRIYLNLGKQLEESLKRIRAKGDQDEAAKVTRGFAAFLARIASRPRRETNFNTLSWVAETFMNLGDSLDSVNGKRPPEAVEYYKKAAETYRAIVAACRADANYAPQPTSVYSIQIRLAKCQRQLGNFDEAIAALVEILKIQTTMIDAQREAAYTYQAWGEEKPAFYLKAIVGGQKDDPKDAAGKYLIWGWGGIARQVQGRASLDSLFHEARYNLALCRFKYALSKTEQEQIKQLEQAKNDIRSIYMLYPKMGGKEWRDKYDELLKKIQKLQRLPENGLKEFDKKMTLNIKKASTPELVACAE